jgi:hypothetical protein
MALKAISIQLPKVAYAASVLFFLWLLAGFYLPGKGFSSLLLIGDKMGARALPELIAVAPHMEMHSYGYDGQFYAQLAISPDLRNPQLAEAIDSLPFRARRILLSWTAWALGGGDPARIIQVFSLQNVVCWLALAVVLLRWFPAVSWENYFRWAGVMFCFGLCFSVRASLLDGPSLLAIAVAVLLYEKGKPWWSAGVLALSGLIRETNILAAPLLAEPRSSWRHWAMMSVRGVLIVAPCALWVLYLNRTIGAEGAGGGGAFALPFTAYWGKIVFIVNDLSRDGWTEANFSSVAMMISLTVQGIFLALRPRWSLPWWRVAAPYLLLMAFLGEAVWEGYPGAASRALLPMALAFNVLLPRGRRWWALLLLGNFSAFSVLGLFRVPVDQCYKLISVPSLVASDNDRQLWEVSFDENWYPPERSRGEYWCWSRGTAEVHLRNPHAFPVLVNVSGRIKSADTREVSVLSGGQKLWSEFVGADRVEFSLHSFRIEPGTTVFVFKTPKEPIMPNPKDRRLLAFSLRNLKFEVTGRASAAGEISE